MNQKQIKQESVTWRLIKWIHKQLSSLVFRVQFLKIVVVSLFVMLVASIYMVHVIYAEDFTAFDELTTTTYLNREVPRGIIYDRNMIPLVRNTSVPVITYRHLPHTYVGTIRQTATYLSELIEVEHDFLTTRDLQDLFILENEEYARGLVPGEEAADMNDARFHQAMIDHITEEHIETLTDEQRQIHFIFTRMYQGAGMTTNIIKENPTDEEIARVTENMMRLPGIEVGVDWSREYPSELGNNPILGTISNHQTGIPREREAYFLSRGYAANARVGTSQIEWAMQSYLSGFQSRYFIEDGVATRAAEGLPGFQVSLNLDTELQVILEEIVAEQLIRARATQTSRFVREAYVVLSDPNTGAVLAMVGVTIDPDGQGGFNVTHNPLGTFQNAFIIGSTVKGATLMAGYYHGATTVGQVRHDVPIRIAYSEPMASWDRNGLGHLDEIRALSMSSNVYFWRQTMDLAGVNHTQGGPIYNWHNDNPAWEAYRHFFASVGLGTTTGIELQNESIGFQAQSREFYNLLHFAIGQSDTYTAMQLAQFAGVIATSGNRMQMQIVQNIYMPGDEGEERQLVRGFEPNLLNRVELTDTQWRNIHQGHRRAVQENEGTGTESFRGVNFRPAGKTGTAEDSLHDADGNRLGIDTLNRTFIGYAPWDNPEVAISVIVPQSQMPRPSASSNISEDIARRVLQAYFDLQSDRERRRD